MEEDEEVLRHFLRLLQLLGSSFSSLLSSPKIWLCVAEAVSVSSLNFCQVVLPSPTSSSPALFLFVFLLHSPLNYLLSPTSSCPISICLSSPSSSSSSPSSFTLTSYATSLSSLSGSFSSFSFMSFTFRQRSLPWHRLTLTCQIHWCVDERPYRIDE